MIASNTRQTDWRRTNSKICDAQLAVLRLGDLNYNSLSVLLRGAPTIDEMMSACEGALARHREFSRSFAKESPT